MIDTRRNVTSLGPNGDVGGLPTLEYDPPRRLVHGWHSLYTRSSRTSRQPRHLGDRASGGRLLPPHVIHDQLEGAPKTAESVSGTGWMMVLTGLKTLLETGDVLDPTPRA